MSLAGKTALVTGGSKGIGEATARALAAEGMRVAMTARGRGDLDRVAGELEAQGAEVLALCSDVSQPGQVEEAVARTNEAFGPIDVLVNNAGIIKRKTTLECTLEDWREVLDINLTGSFLFSRAVLPAMVERGWGRIVMVSSIAGKAGSRNACAYGTSKHGMLGLMRCMAMEFGESGITVNAVCPGWIDTPMARWESGAEGRRYGKSPEEMWEEWAGDALIKRFLQPEEIARMVVFLAREESDGITGQAFNVCGGLMVS